MVEQIREHQENGRRRIIFRGTSGVKRPIRKRFGERVMKLRQQNNLTQEDVGKHFGITKTAVSNIERGIATVSLDRAEEMAWYYRVPIESLIGNDSVAPEIDSDIFEQIRMAWETIPEDRRRMIYDIAMMFQKQTPVMEPPPVE